ncbi:hypothetical protein B6N60_01422 [Richelia sinica FACHB-800]|uniref:Uncharacterized protein n=1 Tax=Richelia sinica FACHB-800 TaxID=1357546 RepID=A0A975T7C0_9NOST|nr:hypothetical protein [Richelia sinica]MBD2663698.1 hypothetical protein [Richelia sinica FACHB-800]QXE22736.1 hypothetical protein B6N60_01422 [Richelia sinica FACHB-800]
MEGNSTPVPQQALAALVDTFVKQGHPPQYAQAIATSIIFQTDLDLRNAQIARLLSWLKEEHNDIYASALDIVEKTCTEFERRVKDG